MNRWKYLPKLTTAYTYYMKYKNTIFFIVLAAGILTALVYFTTSESQEDDDIIFCTADAMQCPDGSYVGRTGPNCEFNCPLLPDVPDDVQAHIDSKADLITLANPVPNGIVESPLTLSGKARGYWFFEASFPIVLTDWDGLIIAESYATANGDWMTEDYVPFTAIVDFKNPYTEGASDFMKKGTLILQKDNPSGLPENDNSLEISVRFAP